MVRIRQTEVFLIQRQSLYKDNFFTISCIFLVLFKDLVLEELEEKSEVSFFWLNNTSTCDEPIFSVCQVHTSLSTKAQVSFLKKKINVQSVRLCTQWLRVFSKEHVYFSENGSRKGAKAHVKK